MIRTHFLAHNLVYVFFALALFAASLLVIELVEPATQPVTYASSNQRQAAPSLNRAQQAGAARLSAAADGYALQSAQQAEIARWSASIQRARLSAQKAAIERWNALLLRARLADARTGLESGSFVQNGVLTPEQLADAARWTGLAIQFGAVPERISPQLELSLRKTYK